MRRRQRRDSLSVTAQWLTTALSGNTRGRLTSKRIGGRQETRFGFQGDHLANVTHVGQNALASYAYDREGRVLGVAGPGGYDQRWERDAAGRVTAHRMGQTLLEARGYDALDRTVARQDAAGNRAELRFDAESQTLVTAVSHEAGADAGLVRVDLAGRDARGRPQRFAEVATGQPPAVVERLVDDVTQRVTERRNGVVNSEREYTPGGRLRTATQGGLPITVEARDAKGRPIQVDHAGVLVSLSWAADEQPVRSHIAGGIDLAACFHYHADRRLKFIRWIRSANAGEACAEPPGDPCVGAVAVYATGEFDEEGKAREVRQCVGGSERTDTLAYDDRGRITAWRTDGRGPLGLADDQTAHFRSYDALDLLQRDTVLIWEAGRDDFPSENGVLAPDSPRDHLHRFEVERIRSDGAPERIRDHETGEVRELAPDAAGRATRFGALTLQRDRQGRPARDQYDHRGRRLQTATAGEALAWDDTGLVTWRRDAATRTFAPTLPGVQLSRRGDGQWEAALLTPTQAPLAVLGQDGVERLKALYSPTGEASEARPAQDSAYYPKTWGGYLKYPGAELYDAGARLYAPEFGQFLEGDPVLPQADAPETWGRYAYGYGDPVGHWDPDGRVVCAVPGAIIGGLLGGGIAAFSGEGWGGIAAGVAAGALTGATCGLALVGQIGAGAAVGAAHGAFGAATHGGDWGVGALRGGLGGAAGGALGAVLGGATNAFGRELAGFGGFAKRAGLNFVGDVGVDVGVQGVLIGAGLQDELDLRGALFSGIAGTAARGAHFGVGAIRAARANGWRPTPLWAVAGVDLPLALTGRAEAPTQTAGSRRAKLLDFDEVDFREFGERSAHFEIEARQFDDSNALGGVYILVDPTTQVVVRTGRSNNLSRREREHAMDPVLGSFQFRVAFRSDLRPVQRGLEHLLHHLHQPIYDRIRPISQWNPRSRTYRRSAARFLSERNILDANSLQILSLGAGR